MLCGLLVGDGLFCLSGHSLREHLPASSEAYLCPGDFLSFFLEIFLRDFKSCVDSMRDSQV